MRTAHNVIDCNGGGVFVGRRCQHLIVPPFRCDRGFHFRACSTDDYRAAFRRSNLQPTSSTHTSP